MTPDGFRAHHCDDRDRTGCGHRGRRRPPRRLAARRRGDGRQRVVLPEMRWLWGGIAGADSLVLNVHIWLGAPFDCSLCYVRDPEHLVRVMSTNPSFLQSSVDDRVHNLRDWGHPARTALPCAKTLVPDPRAGDGWLGRAPAPRHRQRRLAGGWWRRCRCRRCACAMSRRVSMPTRSMRIPAHGGSGSTGPAPLISPRRRSTGAGWSGSRSAPN